MRALLLILALASPQFIFVVPPPPSGPNVTTAGTVTATPTFENIGIRATYTGDANNNGTASIQFRVTGSGTWLDAYVPFKDTRATVYGGSDNSANRYEFRGVIVNRTPGVIYEVKFVYTDPDGVANTATREGTVTMLSDATVVRSGATYYLDDVGTNGSGSMGSPFNTFANAFAGSACGDKLVVNPGTYAAFTFSKTCAPTTWYVIEGTARDSVIISDGVAQNITVDGNYLQVKDVRLDDSGADAIEISTNRHDIWIENVYIEGAGSDAPGVSEANCTAHYNDAAIQIVGGNYRVFIQDSTILAAAALTGGDVEDNCTLAPRNASPLSAVKFGDMDPQGTFVITGNTITGGYRDCIGNSPETFDTDINHIDVGHNTIAGCKDDGIQLESKGINTREWDNTINGGVTCFAHEVGFVGPFYIWRNFCALTDSTSGGGTALKGVGFQAAFIFHNTIKTSGEAHAGLSGMSGYMTAYNNILETWGNPVYQVSGLATMFDYNLYHRIGSEQIVSDWDGTPDYDTVGAFFSAEGQEEHGIKGDPDLDGSLHIDNTSPAYNAGVTLANFNDAHSSVPAIGAPDMGAYEAAP